MTAHHYIKHALRRMEHAHSGRRIIARLDYIGVIRDAVDTGRNGYVKLEAAAKTAVRQSCLQPGRTCLVGADKVGEDGQTIRAAPHYIVKGFYGKRAGQSLRRIAGCIEPRRSSSK